MSSMHRTALLAAALAVAACRRDAETASPPGPAPSSGDQPSAVVEPAGSNSAAGPCDTTLDRFDPGRVYAFIDGAFRDVEDRTKAAFGQMLGFSSAMIRGNELVYEKMGAKFASVRARFQPDPFRQRGDSCVPVDGATIADPPFAPDPCGTGALNRMVLAPDGGEIWECKQKPGRLKEVWFFVTGRGEPPWEFFLIAANGERIPLEAGEGLCRAGHDGRLLLHAGPGLLRVVERGEVGLRAALPCSTTTPIRATDDGFLVVDVGAGPAPAAWRIDRSGATRLGDYPAGNGLLWHPPFALDRDGRLYGMDDVTVTDAVSSLTKQRLVRAAVGDAAETMLVQFDRSIDVPTELVTGP